MADSAVAGLTASGALTGTELFYADNGALDVKVTASQLKTFTGDVHGPASSVDNAVPRFDGTTGKIIQGGTGITVDDNGVALVDQMLMVGNTPPSQAVPAVGDVDHWPLFVDYTYTNAQLESGPPTFCGGIRSEVRGHKTDGSSWYTNALIANTSLQVTGSAWTGHTQAGHMTAYTFGNGKISGSQGLQVEVTLEFDEGPSDVSEVTGYLSGAEFYVNLNSMKICNTMYGVVGQAYTNAVAVIADIYGGWFRVNVDTDATATLAIGTKVLLEVDGTATTTIGLLVAAPSGAGSRTNHSGFKIEDQSGAGSTTSYNMLSKGVSSRNVFEGILNFGTATNSSPQNGDVWFDGTNLKLRTGGTTKTITAV